MSVMPPPYDQRQPMRMGFASSDPNGDPTRYIDPAAPLHVSRQAETPERNMNTDVAILDLQIRVRRLEEARNTLTLPPLRTLQETIRATIAAKDAVDFPSLIAKKPAHDTINFTPNRSVSHALPDTRYDDEAKKPDHDGHCNIGKAPAPQTHTTAIEALQRERHNVWYELLNEVSLPVIRRYLRQIDQINASILALQQLNTK
jgi:hypothetical protein